MSDNKLTNIQVYRKKWNINIGVIIFGVIFIYLVITVDVYKRQVAGRDLITGLPQRREISSTLVRVAIQEPLKDCLRAIQSLLDRIPPEIRKAIYKNGIFLTGGGACLPGLDEHMENALGITVHTAIEPDICAVTGLKQIIMSKELKKLAYSMLNESYRWMR